MFKWVKIILVIILLAAFAFLIREYGFDLGGSDVFEVILKGEKFMVEAADTPAERMQGLSGRSGLSVNEGMLFTFDKPDAHGFWMKDMKFPLDIIWIDKDYRIVHIENNISPDTYPNSYIPERKSRYVIELHSGFAKAHNFVVGQSLFIENLN